MSLKSWVTVMASPCNYTLVSSVYQIIVSIKVIFHGFIIFTPMEKKSRDKKQGPKIGPWVTPPDREETFRY